MEKQTKHSGYIYSKGTKKGFLRMQRLGIPRPPFRLEDKITRRLRALYKKFITKMIVDFLNAAKDANAYFKDGQLVTDGSDKIDKALNATKKNLAKGSHDLTANKSAVQSAISNLQNVWKPDYFLEYFPRVSLEKLISGALDDGATDFMKKFLQDASPKMSDLVQSLSIDKEAAYNNNMDALKRFYIDNSLGRIQGESDLLKKAFLKALTDYVIGNTTSLNVYDLVRKLNNSSARNAQFFARDQMQRFNKAQTLATFVSAGVKTVKWCSCRDARVRESHRLLDGKIFDVHDLPKEINDYNCRCGLVPVEYYDDTPTP